MKGLLHEPFCLWLIYIYINPLYKTSNPQILITAHSKITPSSPFVFSLETSHPSYLVCNEILRVVRLGAFPILAVYGCWAGCPKAFFVSDESWWLKIHPTNHHMIDQSCRSFQTWGFHRNKNHKKKTHRIWTNLHARRRISRIHWKVMWFINCRYLCNLCAGFFSLGALENLSDLAKKVMIFPKNEFCFQVTSIQWES